MPKTTSISFKHILNSILSGVLLTAAFPPGNMEWVIWFALVPLLKSVQGRFPFDAFRLGIVTGMAHYLTLIFWIVFVMKHYGGLNLFTSSGILLLFSFYLALYPGLFSLLISLIPRSRYSILLISGIWVSLEYLKARFLSGFPWCLLGYSQFENLGLIQISDIAGVYGVSFLIISANLLVYLIFFNRDLMQGNKFLRFETAIIVLLFLSAMGYGHQRLSSTLKKEGNKIIRIAMIQGNIDQAVKWDPEFREKTINLYETLSRSVLEFKPHLIVWPETSAPLFFQEGGEMAERIMDISKESGAGLIFGSPAYSRENQTVIYYNRAYKISPKGLIEGYYDKVHLVPFGEYVPLKKYLPFINNLAHAAGDFASGDNVAPIKSHGLSSGILICFEVIFPELARLHTLKGANLLVNLTNDAWFGMTSAPYQHLSMAVFRAVENKRPLIRAANTGFSAYIAPDGTINCRSALFMTEVLKNKVNLDSSSLTFYTRHGDLFAIIISVISLIYIFYILIHKGFSRKNRQAKERNDE